MSAPSQPPPVEPAAAPVPEPGHLRKTFQAFHYPNFRLMWGGAFTSTTGSFVQEVAQSWLVYQLTKDPFLLGLIVFLNNAPILLFSLLGGVAADRMDRRFLLIGSQLVQMTSALALAALIWTDLIAVWHILAAAFFTGIGQAFGGPAYQALIPSLVDRKDVPNAIALMSIQFNLARSIGLPIGGFAFDALGPGACFAINGLSFFAVILSLLLLPPSYVPTKKQQHVMHSLKEGLSFVFGNSAMGGLVLLAMATAFLGVPISALLPVFAEEVFGLDVEGYSGLAAMFAVGGVIGALVVAWMGNRENKGRRALSMQILLGGVTAAFALTAQLYLAGFFLLLAGAAVLAVFASINSLVQLLAPEEMRGRIMSVYNTAFRGSFALGPSVAGYLARDFGAPAVVAAYGIAMALVAMIFWVVNREVREL